MTLLEVLHNRVGIGTSPIEFLDFWCTLNTSLFPRVQYSTYIPTPSAPVPKGQLMTGWKGRKREGDRRHDAVASQQAAAQQKKEKLYVKDILRGD